MVFQSQYNIIKNEEQEVISILQELFDGFSYKILLSVIDEPKTVFQICKENIVPISSAYKKIRKLKDVDLLLIDKIEINEKGKKVVFYKSKIQSIELTLNKQEFMLQLKKNKKYINK
jgi:hypothetical protein